MKGIVYILCGVTALICCILLLRGYRRTTVKLLFWSAVFFAALAIENFVLFADVIVFTEIDLSLCRNSITLAGILVLLYGLIWEKT